MTPFDAMMLQFIFWTVPMFISLIFLAIIDKILIENYIKEAPFIECGILFVSFIPGLNIIVAIFLALYIFTNLKN